MHFNLITFWLVKRIVFCYNRRAFAGVQFHLQASNSLGHKSEGFNS